MQHKALHGVRHHMLVVPLKTRPLSLSLCLSPIHVFFVCLLFSTAQLEAALPMTVKFTTDTINSNARWPCFAELVREILGV